MTNYFSKILLAVVVSVFGAFGASASTIAENTGGTMTSNHGFVFGQSVNIGSGADYTDISFNLYNNHGALAVGDLYILDVAYSGKPKALSTGTHGYVGSVAANSAGTSWDFGSMVTLLADTTYYFYTTTVAVVTGNNNQGNGESFFAAHGVTGHFYDYNPMSINYTLSGTSVAPVPLPATGLLLLTGLFGLGVARRKTKKAA